MCTIPPSEMANKDAVETTQNATFAIARRAALVLAGATTAASGIVLADDLAVVVAKHWPTFEKFFISIYGRIEPWVELIKTGIKYN